MQGSAEQVAGIISYTSSLPAMPMYATKHAIRTLDIHPMACESTRRNEEHWNRSLTLLRLGVPAPRLVINRYGCF
jgi:hypothetical protein